MEAKLERWKDDVMLKEYRDIYLAEDKIPPVDEILDILTFFAAWAMGCSRVGLIDIAKIFNQRFDLYIVGMIEMGYSNEMYYRAGVTVYSPLAQIIAIVSYRVAPEY